MCFYLVYFEDEHCVSIVASKGIITGINEVKVGDKVQIKERGKIYDGTIASYGELM